MRKLMYISDLHQYFRSQGKSIKFSSKDSNSPIVVHVKEPFHFAASYDEELYQSVNLRFCHTEENLNESYISKETMEEAIPTVYNMPILGYIWDDNGTPKFAGHEMHSNEEGEVIYDEIPIGTIPESSTLSLNENENGKTYLEGTGIIWRTYTKAAEILDREKNLSVSVEILVDDLSYDDEKDVLVLNKIRFTGVTILEEDPETGDEVRPGMEGAEISIEDFSIKNSLFAKEEIKKFIRDSIKETLDNINSQRKEENQMNHFNELLEKYGKTVEEITFAYEGLSDEELDAAFAEAFETAPETENPENQDDESQTNEHESEESQSENVEFLVTYKGKTKTFAKSLNDKIKDITALINATYGYEDDAYYDCEVFDETKTVLFHDWWKNKHYRQKYGTKEGNLALKGERTEVFVRYLSEDELTALDELNSKFESVNKSYEEASKELSLYKEEPDKVTLLESDDYSSIKNSKEYEELSKRENYFSLTIDEVKAKLDGMLLEFAKKSGHESQPETKPEKYSCKRYGIGPVSEKHNSRYGDIFSKDK